MQPSPFDLHDRMVQELYEKKSLPALAYLIEAGRELEVTYRGREYFLSRDTQVAYVSLCQGERETGYGSIPLLLEQASLDGVPFRDAWPEVVLGTLF